MPVGPEFRAYDPSWLGALLGLLPVLFVVPVYSGLQQGAFKVYLPRVEAPIEARSSRSPSGKKLRGSETILVVEDNGSLRDVIHETLKERGYTVLLASNGEDAISRAWDHDRPIRLLLTDVVMPRLGGGELARQLVATHPGLLEFFMSGYAAGAASQGVGGESAAASEKPFSGAKLVRAVRDALALPERA